MVIDDQGLVWSWGKGEYGRLGNGGADDQVDPQVVDYLAETACKAVSCGQAFSMVIADTGELWAWGQNDQCQLGCDSGMQVDVYVDENR